LYRSYLTIANPPSLTQWDSSCILFTMLAQLLTKVHICWWSSPQVPPSEDPQSSSL
jgi:hypothetical protein